jgi:uncharacterized protein DUF2829
MNFSVALEAMKDGHRLRRARWSRKNKYVTSVYPKEEKAVPYLRIYVEGESYGPYTPAQCDLFNEDWEIVQVNS